MFPVIRICFLLFFFPEFIYGLEGEFIKGIVFLDKNNNGVFDQEEQGIGKIAVSNGKEVVLTGDDGRWILPVNDGSGVFVIKPAAYRVPVDANMIPRHFFLYPDKTDELPESINFPMLPAPVQDKFTALFFGDTQARGLKEVNYINHDVVAECIGTDALFGLSLGDITADGPDLFNEVAQGIAQIGIPWYNTFGNHDCDRDATTNAERDDSFERLFGPSTYAFGYGQVVFITLNNIFFKPDGKYIPHFTDDQLTFVKNYLAIVPDDRLVVLLMHAPVVACDNREKLFELIRDRKYTFSISGHVHEQIHVFAGKESGWSGHSPHHHLINATVCGSWWCGLNDETGIPHATMNDGAPNGYSVITFDGNRYSIRFKAARRPENYQMNIYLPDEIAVQAADTTKVLVNVFAGSERSLVEMRLDRQESWIRLEQVKTVDPECLRMHRLSPYLKQQVEGELLEDVFGYRMDEPSISTHMWTANLPENIRPGTHTLTVKTTDMFGQTSQASRVFRIR